MSPGLMRGDTGGLASKAYLPNSIVSSKQWLRVLKTANCGLLLCLVKLRRYTLLKCCYTCKINQPFKRQINKMAKRTQAISRKSADELFEYVWSFCGIGT